MKSRAGKMRDLRGMSGVEVRSKAEATRTLGTLRLAGETSPVPLAGVLGEDGEWRIVKRDGPTLEECRSLGKKWFSEMARRKIHACRESKRMNGTGGTGKLLTESSG